MVAVVYYGRHPLSGVNVFYYRPGCKWIRNGREFFIIRTRKWSQRVRSPAKPHSTVSPINGTNVTRARPGYRPGRVPFRRRRIVGITFPGYRQRTRRNHSSESRVFENGKNRFTTVDTRRLRKPAGEMIVSYEYRRSLDRNIQIRLVV